MLEKISSLNNPKNNIEKTETENKAKKISFPHAESILRLFRDKYKDDLEKEKIIENVLYEFFEQEMKNIEIFESKEFGASFPWTVIKTKELTKKIVEKYSDKEDLGERLEKFKKENSIEKQEFIFSSGSIMKSGYPFTFVEEAMHQAISSLKINLLELQEGLEIKDQEIYTIGLPTNEFGKISPEFLEELKTDPFGTMGKLQA